MVNPLNFERKNFIRILKLIFIEVNKIYMIFILEISSVGITIRVTRVLE